MDGSGPHFQVAYAGGLRVRVGKSPVPIDDVDGTGKARLDHCRVNNTSRDFRNCDGVELWTPRSSLGIFVCYGLNLYAVIAWSKHGTMITWVDLWKTTPEATLFRSACWRDRINLQGRARWRAGANPVPADRTSACFQHLPLGSLIYNGPDGCVQAAVERNVPLNK